MARGAARNQQMRDARRERILGHALRLFAAQGLAATTIAQIARAAAMSQGLLYHYFPSKEAIYVELIRHAFGGMNAAARALEALPLSPRDKIVHALSELVRMLDEQEGFATYFMLTAQASLSTATPPAAAAVIRRQRQAPYTVLARILRAGQDDGAVRRDVPAEELAVIFWTTVKGLAMHRAAFGARFEAPRLRLLTSIFLTEPADEPPHR